MEYIKQIIWYFYFNNHLNNGLYKKTTTAGIFDIVKTDQVPIESWNFWIEELWKHDIILDQNPHL